MKRSARWFLLLALLACLGHAPALLAVTCTSVAGNVNWNVATSWTGCVGGNGTVANTPGSNDIAIKAGAGTVTVNVAVTVGELRVNAGTVTQTTALTLVTTGGQNGALSVNGGLFTSSNTLTVNGPTNVTAGTFNFNASTNARIFAQLVSVSGAGNWTNTGNRAVQFRGGIAHSGTGNFNNGTNTTTFNTVLAQTISGGADIRLRGAVTVAADVVITRTNTATVTISGNLQGGNGAATWNNDAGRLDYGGANAPMVTGVLNANNAANIVNYGRAGVQAVDGTTYRTLEIGGPLLGVAASGAKTANAAITVNGDLTLGGTVLMPGTAAFTPGNFTHIFQGNWIVNTTAAAPLTLPTTTSIIRFAPPTAAAATSISGTSAATLTFADLDITNTSGVTFNENVTVSAGTTPTLTIAAATTLTVPATFTLTIGAGAVATPNATALIAGAGTLTGTGTVQVTRTAATADFVSQYTITNKTLTGLTVAYVGAAAQFANGLAYQNLTINNASGVTLSGNASVNGTLTFTAGDLITTPINTLTMTSAALAIVGPTAARHVVGNLARTFPAVAGTTYLFAVGDGTNYTPVTITFPAAPTSGTLTVSTLAAPASDHPDSWSTTVDPTQSVNRYWKTVKDATLAGTFNVTLNYLAADLDAGVAAATMVIARGTNCTGSGTGRTCPTWTRPTLGAPAPTTTQANATGIVIAAGAGEADFVVGEPAAARFSREKEFIYTREVYPP